jgi:hypothetical protein
MRHEGISKLDVRESIVAQAKPEVQATCRAAERVEATGATLALLRGMKGTELLKRRMRFAKVEKPLCGERLRSTGEERERALDVVAARGIARGLAKARPQPTPDGTQRSTDGVLAR